MDKGKGRLYNSRYYGAHSIIYSESPEDDRAFLRDVLKLPNVDVGDGWLIFGLPPAEVAVHPSKKNDVSGGGKLGIYQPRHARPDNPK